MPDTADSNRDDGGKSDKYEVDLRHKLHEIIFGADTAAGIWFDIILLLAILISVICVCLHTVEGYAVQWGWLFEQIEWTLTVLFTIEYVLRLYCVERPWKYATSFFGVVDLLAVLPSYLSLFFPGSHSFAVVRALRLLRVFRILKLSWFVHESEDLARAVAQARAKIIIFLAVVLIAITIAGALMYEIENPVSRRRALARRQVTVTTPINVAGDDVMLAGPLETDDKTLRSDDVDGDLIEPSGFSSIPLAMYWATVTMTTVGYGDIVPQTTAGKVVSAILILLGYSLIIVPTGFVSAEFMGSKKAVSNITCRYCLTAGHDADAVYCKYCGESMSGSRES